MKQDFPMIPSHGGPVWMFAGLSVLFVALIVLFGYLAWSSRHAVFEVSSEGLAIRGDLYGRRIPLASLSLEGARSVDLARDQDLRLKWRMNGSGFPGYCAGWFKLRNGEKALVFVTDSRRVAYIPTRDGYSVLLSTAEPDRLIEALRQAARG